MRGRGLRAGGPDDHHHVRRDRAASRHGLAAASHAIRRAGSHVRLRERVHAYPGSPALYNGNLVFGITTLARQDGGAFSLRSVDMAAPSVLLPGGPMAFEGMLTGGGTVTQTFNVTAPLGTR